MNTSPTSSPMPSSAPTFTAALSDFLNALATVAPAVGSPVAGSRRTIDETLMSVHVCASAGGRLTVTAFNDRTVVSTTIPSTVETPGSALVPYAKLRKLIAAATKGASKAETRNATIRFAFTSHTREGTTDKLAWEGRVSVGGFTVPFENLPNPTAWPQLPDSAPRTVTLARTDLVDALRRVIPAASIDDFRPALTLLDVSVSDGRLWLMATDRYNLARTSVLCDGPDTPVTVTINPHALYAALATCQSDRVSLGFSSDHVTVEADDTIITTRNEAATIGGLPDVGRLLDTYRRDRAWAIDVNASKLQAVVARAMSVGHAMVGKDATVRLLFGVDGAVRVDVPISGASTPAVGTPVPGVVSYGDLPESIQVSMNPQFFTEAIKATSGDTVTIAGTTDAGAPLLACASADAITDPTAMAWAVIPLRPTA